MENLHGSADFSMKCPIDQLVLNLKNFKITDAAIPNYLLIGDLKFQIILRIQAKIPNVKAYVYFYTLKFYGEIRKV